DPVWRIGQAGLADAMAATPNSVVLVVEVAGVTVGFAIVGEMAGVSYLQRLAVHPDHARRGIGRSLVRASVDWARRHGARTMVLNTQPENTAAARLYEDEGFVRLGARLRVLAREGSGCRSPYPTGSGSRCASDAMTTSRNGSPPTPRSIVRCSSASSVPKPPRIVAANS